MGNELTQFQSRMTVENWEFLLKMLQKTLEVLLLRKKADALFKDAKFVRQPRADVFDPPAGPDHNIVARIRPLERPHTWSKTPDTSNMAFNFGTGKPEKGLVPISVLENIPEAWTEESIKETLENLKKLEAEAKLKPPTNISLDKETEIRPPKPEDPSEAWTNLKDWTVFGYLPNMNHEQAKEGINEITKDLKYITIDDRIRLYYGERGFMGGQILPPPGNLRSFLSRIKEEESSENPPAPIKEGEPPPLSPTTAEKEEDASDGKKKKKRQYKKRTPKE